jgi:hypothetical protein
LATGSTRSDSTHAREKEKSRNRLDNEDHNKSSISNNCADIIEYFFDILDDLPATECLSENSSIEQSASTITELDINN